MLVEQLIYESNISPEKKLARGSALSPCKSTHCSLRNRRMLLQIACYLGITASVDGSSGALHPDRPGSLAVQLQSRLIGIHWILGAAVITQRTRLLLRAVLRRRCSERVVIGGA